MKRNKYYKKIKRIIMKNPIIDAFGTESWHNNKSINIQLHREDGPAVIYPNGTQYWYQNGFKHRLDGPAAIYSDGKLEYWINGLRHREDGPAVIYPNGNKYWYKNGQHHRIDGPAIELINGKDCYYLYGEKYYESNYLLHVNIYKLKELL